MSRDEGSRADSVNHSQAILELEISGTGRLSWGAAPLAARSARHAASAFTASRLCSYPLLVFGVGIVRPQVRLPGIPYTTSAHWASLLLRVTRDRTRRSRSGAAQDPARDSPVCRGSIISFNGRQCRQILRAAEDLNGVSLEAILRALEFGGLGPSLRNAASSSSMAFSISSACVRAARSRATSKTDPRIKDSAIH